MNKPRATTAGENKHTSTEEHMSKVEVKVKAGDTWCVNTSGILVQRRDGEMRAVAGSRLLSSEWQSAHGVILFSITEPAARAWIESLGGTVVEEREEAVPSTLTVKIYRSTHDGSLWMIDSPTHAAPSGYAFIGTTTIHIAGVTA